MPSDKEASNSQESTERSRMASESNQEDAEQLAPFCVASGAQSSEESSDLHWGIEPPNYI